MGGLSDGQGPGGFLWGLLVFCFERGLSLFLVFWGFSSFFGFWFSFSFGFISILFCHVVKGCKKMFHVDFHFKDQKKFFTCACLFPQAFALGFLLHQKKCLSALWRPATNAVVFRFGKQKTPLKLHQKPDPFNRPHLAPQTKTCAPSAPEAVGTRRSKRCSIGNKM